MFLLTAQGGSRIFGPFITGTGAQTDDVEQAARFDSVDSVEGAPQRRSTDGRIADRLIPAGQAYQKHAFECISPKGERVAFLVAAPDHSHALIELTREKCVRVLRHAIVDYQVADDEARTQVLCGITGRDEMAVYFTAPDGNASPLSWFGESDNTRHVDIPA
jgi:hypothetical protein